MTDVAALLTAAARAAGMNTRPHPYLAGWLAIQAPEDEAFVIGWNPWQRDTDALELAGRLNMRVTVSGKKADARCGEVRVVEQVEPGATDLTAAMRRAIVKAAAESAP